MAVKYIPDELVHKIRSCKLDTQKFIKEAIEEKLKKINPENKDADEEGEKFVRAMEREKGERI